MTKKKLNENKQILVEVKEQNRWYLYSEKNSINLIGIENKNTIFLVCYKAMISNNVNG